MLRKKKNYLTGIGLVACLGLVACGGASEEPQTGSAHKPIIGGDEANEGAWPWQAQINKNGSHSCGGSILNENWILTAAHCADGVNVAQLSVRLGLHTRSAPGAHVQTRTVSSAVVHPSYNPFTIENDVALLQLSSPITFNKHVQPIAIETNAPPATTKAFVTGWGWTSGPGVASDTLMETILPVRGTATCNSAGTLPLTVRDSMLCAGFVGGEHGGCHGDSGGPLVVPAGFSNGWKQIGVVSWGVGGSCSSYTVFARLSELAGWIEGIAGAAAVVGDTNDDGCVDMADYIAVMTQYGSTVPPADPAADLNDDGIINMLDRLLVLQNFGEGC